MLLGLVPDLHDLQPAVPEAVEVGIDLLVEGQRGSRHRPGEVRVGLGQGLVPLPEGVELVHQADGLLAKTLELLVHRPLQALLPGVEDRQDHQPEDPERRHHAQGHGPRIRLAQDRPGGEGRKLLGINVKYAVHGRDSPSSPAVPYRALKRDLLGHRPVLMSSRITPRRPLH